MRTLVPLLLGVILLAPAIGRAQDNSDIRIDLDRERSADRQTDASGLTPLQRGSLSLFQQGVFDTGPACTDTEWSQCGEVDVLLPLTFNSNPRSTAHQTEDGHGRPSISLIGAVKHYSFSVVASVDTAFDRYIEDSEANSNVLKFWLGALYGLSKQWSLYLGYRPTLTYSDDFEDLNKTFHDVLGGTRWIYDFGTPQKEKLPFRLVTDLNGGPRVADPSTFSATLINLSIGLTYTRFDNQDLAVWSITNPEVEPVALK